MKRTPKFGSRYGFKRFVEGGSTMGGPTSYADSGSAGGTNSFKDAFRSARKQGLKTFKWRGETYHTETADEQKAKAKAKAETEAKTPARQAAPEEFAAQMNMRLADQDKILPDSYMRRKSLRDQYPELGRKESRRDDSSPKFQDLKDLYAALRRNPTEKGYKRGGKVKSSASRRADGIAVKGKTRGKFV
jgi:hypothetical protein